jgi:hypothetical protein
MKEPSMMSREAAAHELGGLHLQSITRFCREGRLERVFIGRRSMVTTASVKAFIRRARLETVARGKKAMPEELAKSGSRSAKKGGSPKTPAETLPV